MNFKTITMEPRHHGGGPCPQPFYFGGNFFKLFPGIAPVRPTTLQDHTEDGLEAMSIVRILVERDVHTNKYRAKVRSSYLSHRMIEPFYRYEFTNNSWQGRQAGNQTCEEDDWKFEVEEIRELLDASNGEDDDLSSVSNKSGIE